MIDIPNTLFHKEIRFQGSEIKFLDHDIKTTTKKIYRNVEEFPYGNNFYFQAKKEKIIRILETFYFDNYGQFESRFRSLAKKIFFKSDSTHGCNSSPKKIYHKALNHEVRMNCISIEILDSKEDIYGPNFGSIEHLSLHLRKNKIKNYLRKNKLEVPEKFIRTEHYFYKGGKIVWIFLTSSEALFPKNLNKAELSQYIEDNINDHQIFESNLRFGSYDKINFD